MTELREKAKENETQTAIEIHGLSKSFGNFYSVKGLKLQIPKNSVFAFSSPNDAGKTTTIKLFLGLSRLTSSGRAILGHDFTMENKTIFV